MNEYFTPNVNFLVDCATSNLTVLKCLLLNCTRSQLSAVVEAIINISQLTCDKDCHNLAQTLTDILLSSSEGLWRDVLRTHCEKLRRILAHVVTSCVQEEFLHILCCENEDI